MKFSLSWAYIYISAYVWSSLVKGHWKCYESVSLIPLSDSKSASKVVKQQKPATFVSKILTLVKVHIKKKRPRGVAWEYKNIKTIALNIFETQLWKKSESLILEISKDL